MSDTSSRSPYHTAWNRLHDHLETIRKDSGEELLRYPQPATECDLHYRDLLERRRDVNMELGALAAGEPGDGADDTWRAWFEDRVAASAFVDEALRSELGKILAAAEAA